MSLSSKLEEKASRTNSSEMSDDVNFRKTSTLARRLSLEMTQGRFEGLGFESRQCFKGVELSLSLSLQCCLSLSGPISSITLGNGSDVVNAISISAML